MKFTILKPFSIMKNQKGFSLLEVTVAAAVMIIMGFMMMTMQSNLKRSNNFLEFQLKRAQLQAAIVGQVLNNSDNCLCLFQGAGPIPVAGAPTLPGAPTPTQIGRFSLPTPGSCAGATIPVALVNTAGTIDGLKLTSVQVQNIVNVSGAYSANLAVKIQSMKEVSGPATLAMNIPININTAPGTPGNVLFAGCGSAGGAGAGGFTSELLANTGYVEFPNGLILQWGRVTVNSNGVTTVYFPKPFTAVPYSITVSGTSDSGTNSQDNWPTLYRHPANTTTTYFQIFSANGANDPMSWMAVGK
jgi:type II secretory pathway pseudopilin PulG